MTLTRAELRRREVEAGHWAKERQRQHEAHWRLLKAVVRSFPMTDRRHFLESLLATLGKDGSWPKK